MAAPWSSTGTGGARAQHELFELLERVQCSRLDDQRAVLPPYFSQVSANLTFRFYKYFTVTENSTFYDAFDLYSLLALLQSSSSYQPKDQLKVEKSI